jgi:Fe-S-cluster containining protein
MPTVAALVALWQEVAQKPLWAPPNFFRYLALRRRLKLRLLRAEQMRIVAPPGKVNDCTACTNLCCSGPRSTVLLRLLDIAKLIDIKRTDLMTQQKPQFTAEQLAANMSLHRQVASESWQRFPVLKQNAFGACQALSDAGLCTLYPNWPLTCARFPYALHVEAQQLVYAPRCASFYIHPRQKSQVSQMQVAAVAAYNERIKDAVLLAYAPKRLSEIGIMPYLRSIPLGSGGKASIGAF